MTCYDIVSDCHAFLSDLRVQGTVVGFFLFFISRTVGGLTVGLLTVQVPYLYYKQPGRIGSSFVLGRTTESLVRRTSDLFCYCCRSYYKRPYSWDSCLGYFWLRMRSFLVFLVWYRHHRISWIHIYMIKWLRK